MGDEAETNKRRFLRGLAAGEAAAAAEVYLDDATLVTPTGEVIRGREAIESFWRAGLEVGLQGAEFDIEDAARGDGLSTQIGRYRFLVEEQRARARQESGVFLLADKRTADGSWKRVLDLFISSTASQEPPPPQHEVNPSGSQPASAEGGDT